MAQQNSTKRPPLGYWLKHADEVITKHINQVLSDHGFTRFHWQVLNIVYEVGTIAPQPLKGARLLRRRDV